MIFVSVRPDHILSLNYYYQSLTTKRSLATAPPMPSTTSSSSTTSTTTSLPTPKAMLSIATLLLPPKPKAKPQKKTRVVKRTGPRGVPMPSHVAKIRNEAQAHEMLLKDLDEFQKRPDHSKIPKIIHQIYRNTSIPDVYSPYIRSWVKHNPDFEYYFWDDNSGPEFVRKHYKEFAPLYEAYCHDLMRSDALRYFVLHKYGGIYADADYECYKPIYEIINTSECHLVQENWAQAKLLYNTDLLVQNSFMASTPGHPFLKFVINRLPSAAPIKDCHLWKVLSATGPILLDKSRLKYEKQCGAGPCKINVLPYTIMMPEFDTDKGKPRHYTRICARQASYNKLSSGSKKACDYFKNHFNGPMHIGPEVYASHKFLHLGNDAHKYRAKSYNNISDLVPKVIFPEV